MDAATGRVFLVPERDGQSVWVTDELVTIKVTGETTGGLYSLTDSRVPPEGGPPRHVHEREDEAFWILEGELEIAAGEERFVANVGSFVRLPRGVPRSYRNVGTGSVGFLTLMVPAGLEKFFEEVGVPGADVESPPAIDPEAIDTLSAAASRFGITILAPEEA
jgi:mannose-6-phosphate isomerase-like protein (cupin superfamily)